MIRIFPAFILLLLIIQSGGSLQAQDEPTTYTTTAHGQDGNRYVRGQGTFPDVMTTDVTLQNQPAWLVGATIGNAPAWVAVDPSGVMQGIYAESESGYTASGALSGTLEPGMPPLMVTDAIGSYVDEAYPDDMARYTHATRADGRTAYVAADSDVVLLDENGDAIQRHEVNAQPDARIVLNRVGQAAFYTGATDERYVHGIMGDDLEASGLAVMDMGTGQITGRAQLDAPQVFEGLSPFWADVNFDGDPELIATASNGRSGAQLRAYTADGSLLAEGPSIGMGARWRHQLAWAPFGPNGESLLAEVLTPHIGGQVGFFRFNGDSYLERVASTRGYTSHVINSRNLDMAVAGDFDGDGQPELVLPNQERTRIAGLAINQDFEVAERWSLPLDGTLVSNLSAVELPDGGLALAAGIEGDDGTPFIRLWR